MTNAERIILLNEAQDKIGEAREMIKEAVKGTGEEKQCDVYILPHLQGWSDDTRDYTSIPNLIERLLEEGFDDEEIERPKMEIGQVAKDYNGEEYTVLAISRKYDDVSQYDSTGAGQEMVESPELLEDEWWFVGVRAIGGDDKDTEYVFGVSSSSDMLGQ